MRRVVEARGARDEHAVADDDRAGVPDVALER